jgi:hypothetical protein
MQAQLQDQFANPEVATQTSPEALLTCQAAVAASSARSGAAAPSATNATNDMRIPSSRTRVDMKLFPCGNLGHQSTGCLVPAPMS